MSNIDNTKIAQMRQQVHEQIPEALDFIGELYKLGMIDGWRNVVHVGPANDPEREKGYVSPSWQDLSGKGFARKDPA